MCFIVFLWESSMINLSVSSNIPMSFEKFRIQNRFKFVYKTDVSLYTKNFETPTNSFFNSHGFSMKVS